MDDMPEAQRVEAAKLRDQAAAAAQGDYTAWARLLDVIHAPDARMRALEAENAALREQLARGCPHCGRPFAEGQGQHG